MINMADTGGTEQKRKNKRKFVLLLAALAMLVFSMTFLSNVASNPQNHRKTITALDERRADVLKLTASTVAASTAIAAVPGDSTTPIANKLADLTSYFTIILMVVFLEKYLVTLTGFAAFSILVPIACILFAVGICMEKSFLKILAAKIAAFGLVLFLIIPISMEVSAIIERTYETTIEATIEEAQEITDNVNENTDSEGNFLNRVTSKFKESISGLLDKGENLLNHFIEVIAVMMVTSCIIPIIVLLFMLWLVRMLFGVQVNIPKNLPEKRKRTEE